MPLIEVFGDILFPLLLLSSLGALVGRSAKVPTAPLSDLAYNLFTPALVFDTLVAVDIQAALVPKVVAVVTLAFVVSAALGAGWAAGWRQPRPVVAATALSLAATNLGDMGLPVAELAFGREGLGVAVVAFVTGSVMNNSFGIVIASLSDRRIGPALRAPLRVPALWAVVPALFVRELEIALPSWLQETTGLLAQAAIPVMLVVLGLQATSRRIDRADVVAAAGPTVLRLLAGPGIALGATWLLDVEGVARATLVVLGGMPTAVIATVIATRHAAAADRVARTVMVSTLGSFVTLATWISLLR